MKDALAERLLAEVMKWGPEDIARERPLLQALAAYKFDEYQQFSPGMRFVESFALWLSQFDTSEEKQVAYRLVTEKLVFVSTAEMNHLVTIAYHDHIRPILLKSVAKDNGLSQKHIARVATSQDFRVRQRQCLFLGLSDGSRIDTFRRVNRDSLTHEQVWQTYEISNQRADVLLTKLRADLGRLIGPDVRAEELKFRTLVLLDDFSASGISYLRREPDSSYDGKIAKFYHSLRDTETTVSKLVNLERLRIFIVLYIATEQARRHLQELAQEMLASLNVEFEIIVVYPLREGLRISPGQSLELDLLLGKYYDDAIETESTRKGGMDLRYGFAGCGLPVILSHNTPNNSLGLLWMRTTIVRPLFPRISRH